MAGSGAELERRLCNRLTCIRLALQILDRRTELSDYQHRLSRTAIDAADSLTADLLEQREWLGLLRQPDYAQHAVGSGSWASRARWSGKRGLIWGLLVPLGWRALTGLGRQVLRPRMVGMRAPGRPWTDLRLKPRRRR